MSAVTENTIDFFRHPVLNNPYERPTQHWELENGQPTGNVLKKRRPADFITPIPKTRERTFTASRTKSFCAK